MKQILLILLVCASAITGNAQVGIGTSTPNESAQLELSSSTRGFLPPRLTTTQKLAIANPVPGLLLYDRTQQSLNIYTIRGWEKVLSPSISSYTQPTNVTSHLSSTAQKYGHAVSIGSYDANGGLTMVGAPGALDKEGYVDILNYHTSSGKYLKYYTLSPADLEDGDQFGFAVATDRLNRGSDMVAGAPFSTESGFAQAGSAYFYNHLGFHNQVFAPAARQVANARFGRSVDVAASTNSLQKGFAIVGAPGANASKGEAYIYEFNPNSSIWEHRATLTDNLGAAADSFGLSVAIHYKANADTGWAFVGAPYDDENGGTNTGSITAFRKAAGSSLWTRVGKITLGNNVTSLYGYSLSAVMDCKKLFAGAPYSVGKVFAVELTTLVGSTASFINEELPTGASSGNSTNLGIGASISAMAVGTDCNKICLASGALYGFGAGTGYGYVSVLESEGPEWILVERQMMDPIDVDKGAGFGKSVSVHAARRSIIVGSPEQDANNIVDQGKVQTRVF